MDAKHMAQFGLTGGATVALSLLSIATFNVTGGNEPGYYAGFALVHAATYIILNLVTWGMNSDQRCEARLTIEAETQLQRAANAARK